MNAARTDPMPHASANSAAEITVTPSSQYRKTPAPNVTTVRTRARSIAVRTGILLFMSSALPTPKLVQMMLDASLVRSHIIYLEGLTAMMTAGQLRAARALLGLDQRTLAELSGISLPTIQCLVLCV